MRGLLNKIKLRYKISLIMWLVSTIAIVIGSVIYMLISISVYKHQLVNQTILDAHIISDYCVLPLEFNDFESAVNILEKLKANPNFNNALIYNDSSQLFARYNPYDKEYIPKKMIKRADYYFENDFLIIAEPIKYKAQVHGYLFIVIRTGIYKLVSGHIEVALYIILGILILSYLLAYYFQRFISSPIVKLKDALFNVSQTASYDFKLKYPYNDEFGQLYNQIEDLLAFIKNREFQLVQAKNKAEESDKLKSSFLANISHEIRTPMNAIINFAELLTERDELSDEDAELYSKIINSRCNELLKIINDIINISKIESNTLTLRSDILNINTLIDEVCEYYVGKQKIEEKNIKIISCFSLVNEQANIISYPKELKQILNNLLSNAYKFTKKGQIKTSYRIVDKELIISVEDTGIGIPDDKIRMIFERFRQVEDYHTRNYGGVGLGLAISKALAEMMNGKLWAESKENIGTTFHFSLPIVQISQSNKNIIGYDSEIVIQDKLNILIVEDDENNCLLLKTIVDSISKHIDMVFTGRQAIEIIKNNAYDVILMDIQMPGMNGFETMDEIRKITTTPVFIAQTAISLDQTTIDSITSRFDAYITKPFEREGLLRLISDQVNKKKI